MRKFMIMAVLGVTACSGGETKSTDTPVVVIDSTSTPSDTLTKLPTDTTFLPPDTSIAR
jgi:hypothetical protein